MPFGWFSGLAILLGMVEATADWPQGLLNAYIAIPKVDGDSTPLGQRLLWCYFLWCMGCGSPRLGHLEDWVQGWVPQSVFSLGNGLS